MGQPRTFADVLVATIAEVPADQTDLRRRLTKVLEDSAFTAPEARWALLGWKVEAVMEDVLGRLPCDQETSGWRATVLAAWTGTQPERSSA